VSAAEGERKIRWVAEWMPVLNRVRDRLAADGVVGGRRLAVILPVEPKTAYLAAILAEAGAEVTVAFQGSMVHDDVAAGLRRAWGRGVRQGRLDARGRAALLREVLRGGRRW
jgi:adenosylhomocysteinase